jgi:peptide deformylase
MSVLPLCQAPHPALEQRAEPVTAFTDELARLVQDLIDTMYAHDGIGIAAPQVGRPVQLFIANPSQRRGQELVIANPVLEDLTGRTSLLEGCLSLPGTWERVTRAARVRLTGADTSGAPQVIAAEGLLAIVLQHEYDHLHGRLFIDRLPWWRRRGLRRRAHPRSHTGEGVRAACVPQQASCREAVLQPLR